MPCPDADEARATGFPSAVMGSLGTRLEYIFSCNNNPLPVLASPPVTRLPTFIVAFLSSSAAAGDFDQGSTDLQVKQERKKAQAGERITVIGTVVNVFLTIFKLIAGIVGKSSAMVADSWETLLNRWQSGQWLMCPPIPACNSISWSPRSTMASCTIREWWRVISVVRNRNKTTWKIALCIRKYILPPWVRQSFYIIAYSLAGYGVH